MKKGTTQTKKLNFEDTLSKLEDIIRQMEEGGQPLEKMLDQFEEGTKLVEQCRKALDEAELRVSLLMKEQSEERLKNLDENDSSGN